MTARLIQLVLTVLCGCTASPPQSTPDASPTPSASGVVPELVLPSKPTKVGSTLCPNLSFGADLPPDVNIGSQTVADCFGWQEFIALNWPASGSSFGSPGDTSEVQWQGFMNTHQLFQPNGAPPPPWGTEPTIDPSCLQEAGLTAANAHTVHPLVNATKFSSETLSSSSTAEAFPRNAPAWLGDVNGNNVWYEVRVNKDEYDAIVANKLYDAAEQAAFYSKQPQPPTTPLQLPAGCAAGTPGCARPGVGAVELKAAWMEVPSPADPRWSDYKITKAVVVDASTQKCRQVTVALVGLHIIHKTLSQPTWIWATFEHRANAPTTSDASGQAWNFNSSACAAKSIDVPVACQYNGQAKVTTTCDPNKPPQYVLGDGCPAPSPTQVTRLTPLDSQVMAVNADVQAAINTAFPGSVWENYILVNVVWSSNPPQIPPACQPGPGCQVATVPQVVQSLNPTSPVANTVLETYIQTNTGFQKSNCIICHQSATIPGGTYTSDFSFALGDAQSSKRSAAKLKQSPFHVRRVFR